MLPSAVALSMFTATPPERRPAWRAAWLRARRAKPHDPRYPGAHDLDAAIAADDAVNLLPCRDCGTPTRGQVHDEPGAPTCTNCDQARVVASSSCRACCRWILRESVGGPRELQHAGGCPLQWSGDDYPPRGEEELAEVREARLRGRDRLDLWRRADAVIERVTRKRRAYLALCSRAHDLHVTVIHVPADLPDPPLVAAALPLRLRVTGEATFGPPEAPVRALTIDRAPALLALRAAAEDALRARGVEWTTRWPFNPHATVPANWPGGLPEWLEFEALEWR